MLYCFMLNIAVVDCNIKLDWTRIWKENSITFLITELVNIYKSGNFEQVDFHDIKV